MNTAKIITIAAFALCLGASSALQVGCSSSATRRSTGEYVDDVAITTKIKAALVKDDMVKAREIGVTTYSGTVQLSGFVASQAEKQQAERLARAEPGVREVRNDITIKP